MTLGKWNIGLFAKGPKRILEFYFNSLEKSGKEPYYYNTHQPKKWIDGEWFLEDTDLKLALLGGTYFIGKKFTFNRLK